MASDDPRDPQYGFPYTGVADVQSVTITGAPTGGTFTITIGGQTTSGLAFNATAATVQTAVQGLSSVGSGNALVTGSAGGPYTITFAGSLAPGFRPTITASGAGLTGGTSPAATVAHVTSGTPVQQAARGGSQTVLDMARLVSVRITTSANDNHYTPNGDLYHE